MKCFIEKNEIYLILFNLVKLPLTIIFPCALITPKRFSPLHKYTPLSISLK